MLPQPLPSPERRHSRPPPPKVKADPVFHLLEVMLDFEAPASDLEAANNDFEADLRGPFTSFPGTARN